MNPGNIILLNGTSSSGKSTLARALLELLGPSYFHVDLDLFQRTQHPNFIAYSDGSEPVDADGFLAIFQEDTLVEVRIGPAGLRYMEGIFRAIAGWASVGDNLIVEGAIYHPQVLSAAIRSLDGLSVLFVGIHCPLEVAEEWERKRGNRARGGARTFHHLVHAHGIYDLEVDTSLCTPMECAQLIAVSALNNRPRIAFARLKNNLG